MPNVCKWCSLADDGCDFKWCSLADDRCDFKDMAGGGCAFGNVEHLTAKYDEAVAACAKMREALEKVRTHAGHACWDPRCENTEIFETVNAALSSTSLGADMLQRIRQIEADNEVARGLLKQIAYGISDQRIISIIYAFLKEAGKDA